MSAVDWTFPFGASDERQRQVEVLRPREARHAHRAADRDDPPRDVVSRHEIARQAAMIAYNNSFLIIAICSAAAAPLLLLFRRNKDDG